MVTPQLVSVVGQHKLVQQGRRATASNRLVSGAMQRWSTEEGRNGHAPIVEWGWPAQVGAAGGGVQPPCPSW